MYNDSGIYCYKKIMGEEYSVIPETTVLGALAKYITTENKDFQPMNANFGILPPLSMIRRDKAERKKQIAIKYTLTLLKLKKHIC